MVGVEEKATPIMEVDNLWVQVSKQLENQNRCLSQQLPNMDLAVQSAWGGRPENRGLSSILGYSTN